MHQQSVKQVCGATLWLTNDVKVRQAAQAEVLAASAAHVLLEVGPQVVAHVFEALRAETEAVLPVWVRVQLTGELFIPAWALDTGQEMAWHR